MPDLDFRVEGVAAARFAATPTLDFDLRVSNAPADEEIANVMLQCQIQLEALRRRYEPGEQENLLELFGEPQRWGQTLRTLLWTHVSVQIPAFSGSCLVALPVPCTYDFNVLSAKYFHALGQGDVPLTFQFSGSVFYRSDGDTLQVSKISWSKEASFRLPVQVWRQMMDHHYPNGLWLCINRDVFDRLQAYKLRSGVATWEQAFEGLLDGVEVKYP